MSYNGDGIEAVRFGARLGRVGIGCCGLDLIQGFSHSPEDETTFPLRYGDEDTPIFDYSGEEGGGEGQLAFKGTNLDVLKALLTLGTFDQDPKCARSFLVTLSRSQLEDDTKAWLPILAELGFEFIRSFENGVYGEGNYVYLFGYFRNESAGSDGFGPPEGWSDLPKKRPEFIPADFSKVLTTLSE